MKRNLHLRFICLFLLLCAGIGSVRSQSITTTTVSGTSPYCAGSGINVTFTISGTFSNSPSANVFTAELSDLNGGFASPVALGTRTATSAGVIACTIPFNTATSSLYRIRVKSSNPAINGSDNGSNLTVNAPTITTPTVSTSQFCQGENFNVAFGKTCNFASGNIYTFQLSNPSGSFSSPTALASYTSTGSGTFSMTIPPGTPAGTGYRIRLVSSAPIESSPDNGSDITISAIAGNPSVPGVAGWNAYCYNALNNFTTAYQGFYAENPVNINTQSMYTSTNSPSSATGTNGVTYAGCPFGNTNYSVEYIRTNIPCGYYQIDIPGHDDNIYILINGTNVFQHIGCCDAHTNVWTGFIGPSTTVQCRYSNGGGPGYQTVNFTPVNPLSMSAPVTICSGSSASLTVYNSSTVALNYSWTPGSSTGSTVIVSPTTSTTYTVSGTDSPSGCSVTNTLFVTVNASPTTTMAATSTLICAGVSGATLTAGGANTYTWAPASGLNTTTGNSVIASPTINTTYTVTGSNNCSALSVTKTLVVQTPPATPANTVFGNGTWNVYCNNNTTLNNYYGFYTENNLSFDTQVRWNSTNGPSTCTTTSSGSAYSGCSFPGTLWSLSLKRTGIPCGYYQIDIPSHDDGVTLFINGTQVFQHTGCCDAHTAVWTGFIGPSTTVEFQIVNTGGPGNLAAGFTPIAYPVLGPPVTICAGTSATLTSNFISGATYSWSPAANLSTPSSYTTLATPPSSTNYTCSIVDPASSCSAAATVSVSVNPATNVTVSPTSATVNCASNVYTLTASGANTYSWLPSSGLSSATGYTVIASPSVTTVYTVTGSNNCVTSSATTSITVVPLISPTVFPTGAWNAYCYGDQTFSSYYGYYTENGSGTSGYNFSTATRFSSTTPIPSNANTTNGTTYTGCTLTNSNWSISFKRTGFTCGTYSVSLLHDDFFYLLVNGVQVAQHTNGINDTHNGVWVGVLNQNSTVELHLVQTTGSSVMSVTFAPVTIPASQSTWIGANSSDWYTSSNWCGSGIPDFNTDVVIPAAGPQNMPVISSGGAQCKNLSIGSSTAAGTYNGAIPAASLSISGAFSLDVYGNWINGGSFSTGSGTVSILGSANTSFSCASTSTQTIYNLTINKTGSAKVTLQGGTHAISNALVLTNGIITHSATALQVLNGANASGASNASYVDGQVVKIGSNPFVFPVGTGGLYRPITMSAPAQATDNFVAQYFIADPNGTYSVSLKDNTLDHISRCEYWILNRALGVTSNVSVTLTWDANSCGVNSLTDLRVARWDAGQVKWKDQGNGGTGGTTSTGTIITNGPVTNFSPFTFGSANSNNPLPITLKTFNCSPLGKGHVELNWTTEIEHNNDCFVIQSSTDGTTFKSIGKVKGAGNSLSELNYNFVDYSPVEGIAYYRLKQMNFDGSFSYSPLCFSGAGDEEDIVVYPNPVSNELTVELNYSAGQPFDVKLKNVLGNDIAVNTRSEKSKMILDMSDLAGGIYFISVTVNGKTNSSKVEVVR